MTQEKIVCLILVGVGLLLTLLGFLLSGHKKDCRGRAPGQKASA